MSRPRLGDPPVSRRASIGVFTMTALGGFLTAFGAKAQTLRPPSRIFPTGELESGCTMPEATRLPAGYFSTKGNQIVDETGRPVRISGVGWNQNFSAIPEVVAGIRAAGFNAIRVSWVNATLVQDLIRIDEIVRAARQNHLRVVLDNHTNEPGHGPRDNWGAQQKNGLWYDLGGASDDTDGGGNKGTVTDEKFQQDWVTVARHYADDDTVIGYDLRNEPLAYPGMCTWGDGSNRDIRAMYQRVGNAIQQVDSRKLIIAEGPLNYSGSFARTGPAPWGDLSLAARLPVTLTVPDKVVYSIHDYPRDIGGYRPDSGPAKVAQMNAAWGYLVTRNIAPVWIGELGASMKTPDEVAWAKTLLDYMNGRLGALGGPTFSGDQQGIGGIWWAWGHLEGQKPDGTLNADGSLRAAQKAVWMQMLPGACPLGVASDSQGGRTR